MELGVYSYISLTIKVKEETAAMQEPTIPKPARMKNSRNNTC